MRIWVQGVLGYVILRPLMTAVGVVAQLLGVYGDGKLRFDCVYLYTTIISNVSQVMLFTMFVAMASLPCTCQVAR